MFPAASYALRLLSSSPTYTRPFATTGDEMPPPSDAGETSAVQRGSHTFGVPEQFVPPKASNAISLFSSELTYTTPLANAGDESK